MVVTVRNRKLKLVIWERTTHFLNIDSENSNNTKKQARGFGKILFATLGGLAEPKFTKLQRKLQNATQGFSFKIDISQCSNTLSTSV